jgi:hypothetical protein
MASEDALDQLVEAFKAKRAEIQALGPKELSNPKDISILEAARVGAQKALGSDVVPAIGEGVSRGVDTLLSSGSLDDAWNAGKSAYKKSKAVSEQHQQDANEAHPGWFDAGTAVSAIFPIGPKKINEALPSKPVENPKVGGIFDALKQKLGKGSEAERQLNLAMKNGNFSPEEIAAAQKQLKSESPEYQGVAQKQAAMKLIGRDVDATQGLSSLEQAWRGANSPKQQEYLLSAQETQRNLARMRDNSHMSEAELQPFEKYPEYEIKSYRDPDGRLQIRAVTPEGKQIGSVDFKEHPEGLEPGSVEISPLRKNWGIAKKMYEHARNSTNKQVLSMPDAQTPEGKGFRASQGMKHVMAGSKLQQAFNARKAAEVEQLRNLLANPENEPAWEAFIDLDEK